MADPDLQIREGEGEGGRSSIPRDKGGARSQIFFFSALRASVWSKNKGGGEEPGPLPLIRH